MAVEATRQSRTVRLTATAIGAILVGHLGLLVVFPSGPDLLTLLAVEAGGLAVLAAAELLVGMPEKFLIVLGTIYTLLLVATGILLSATDSVIVASLVLVAASVLAAYGIHRYELVALGLVEAPDEQ